MGYRFDARDLFPWVFGIGGFLSNQDKAKSQVEDADASFTDWLYGEYDEKKLRQFEFLHNAPLVGSYMDYKLDLRADQEYLDRYGLDYSDVHDPRKLRQVSSGSRFIGDTFNFVSSNARRLYR